MAYFDRFDKNIWNQFADAYKLFDPYPLDENEIMRSQMIADEIIGTYQERVFLSTKKVDFGTVLSEAATVYYNLGMHSAATRAVSILSSVQFQDNCSYNYENFTVQSAMVQTGAMVSKKPCYIEVPRVFNSSSVHFMTHEIAHTLKESNPYECRGIYSDVEVIPILIELISAHLKNDDNVFKKREVLMLDIACVFKNLSFDKANNLISDEDLEAFEACYRQNILYLNSFYYSLRLFNMYLNNQEFVISIINKVLSHEMTTKEVIDIYLSFDTNDYDFGLEEFRKRLK